MSSTNGRLTRLEDRLPKGCPTCRTWEAGAIHVGFQGDEPELVRGDDCSDCGRHVPLRRVVIGPRPDGPA